MPKGTSQPHILLHNSRSPPILPFLTQGKTGMESSHHQWNPAMIAMVWCIAQQSYRLSWIYLWILIDGNTKGTILGECANCGVDGGCIQAQEGAAHCSKIVRQLYWAQLCLLQIHHHLHQASWPPPLRNDLPSQKDIPAGTLLPTQSQALKRELKSTFKRVKEDLNNKK